MTTAHEDVLRLALAALKANHQWHQEHDFDDLYPGSELEEQNVKAIAGSSDALAALEGVEPVVWTATRLWNARETWTCPADIEPLLPSPQPAAPDDQFRAGFLAGQQYARGETDAPAPDPILCEFYGVESFPDLVAAQERHIERLQAKLPKDNQPAFTRVREG